MSVADAAGITLLHNPADSVQEAIDEAFWHKPSMLQDVLARRRTEVDVLNGGIAAEGRRVGVATPGHDAMVALVHGLESSWT
jgi:2-dehydropantoate 2-reductase